MIRKLVGKGLCLPAAGAGNEEHATGLPDGSFLLGIEIVLVPDEHGSEPGQNAVYLIGGERLQHRVAYVAEIEVALSKFLEPFSKGFCSQFHAELATLFDTTDPIIENIVQHFVLHRAVRKKDRIKDVVRNDRVMPE